MGAIKTGALILSGVVLLAGLYPPAIFRLFSPVLREVTAFNASKFVGGLLSIPKGLLIISGNGFGCISPTVLAIFLFVLSTSVAFLLKLKSKANGIRYDMPWNGGETSENYKPSAYSAILKLTLKSFYRTKEEESSIKLCDVLDEAYERLAKAFSAGCDRLRVELMNGSTGIYVLYILLAMIAVLIYSFV